MNLNAQLVAVTDRRGTPRHKLKLGAQLAHGCTGVIVRDLSTHGFRLETSAPLDCGQSIDVVLPETGPTEAVVVWRDGRLFGGRFMEPVSKATVSAALLLSEPGSEQSDRSTFALGARSEETPVAPARAVSGAAILAAVAGAVALLGLILGYLLPVGLLIAVATVALIAGLFVLWGYWILDNTIEL